MNTSEGIIQVQNRSLMEEIREEATKRIMSRGYRGITQFLDALAQEGLVVWLEYFPRICSELREINYRAQKLSQDLGSKGRFTESYGWSEDGTFRLAFEYTPEFYFFMKNFVYTGFFDKDNEKIKSAFMKNIMRGEDPIECLVAVKKIYGSNQQDSPVVHGGQSGSDA